MISSLRRLYQRVDTSGYEDISKQVLLSEHKILDETPLSCQCQVQCVAVRRRNCMIDCLYLLTAGAAILVVIFVLTLHTSHPSDQACARRLSSSSPALAAVEYHDTDFANSFAQKSPYRGPPTEEREKLWFNLWAVNDVLVSPHELQQLNRSGENYVKARPEYGDGYIGLLEAFHQIHCLDVIRQYTWWLMGKYPEDRVPPPLTAGPKGNRIHVDHCIESLRLSLMCQADVTPVLTLKVPTAALGEKGEFSSHHKCRNFTRIKEWVAQNKVVGEETPGTLVHGHLGHHVG